MKDLSIINLFSIPIGAIPNCLPESPKIILMYLVTIKKIKKEKVLLFLKILIIIKKLISRTNSPYILIT